MDFKAGDVVKLKSGGPKMTIKKICSMPSSNEDDGADCCWFDNNEVKDGKFPLITLEKVGT